MHDAPVDFILTQGRFTTLDPSVPVAEAVAIAAGRFAAIGDFDDLIGEAGPTTRIIDLGGRRVIPSPLRSQIHLSMTGVWVGGGEILKPATELHLWATMAWLASGPDKLSRIQALELWVEPGAGGVIRVGRPANLIVLSSDLMTVPEAQILDLAPVLVLFDGKVVHSAGPFQRLASDQTPEISGKPSERGASSGPPVIGRRG